MELVLILKLKIMIEKLWGVQVTTQNWCAINQLLLGFQLGNIVNISKDNLKRSYEN